MTEDQALQDLNERGVWRIAPGLWVDKSLAEFIAVDGDCDTALAVRAALVDAEQLPPKQTTQ